MSTTEYHVVIACPEHWTRRTVDLLANRLSASELPHAVGVFVWTLEDGKLAEQECIRDGRFDDEHD